MHFPKWLCGLYKKNSTTWKTKIDSSTPHDLLSMEEYVNVWQALFALMRILQVIKQKIKTEWLNSIHKLSLSIFVRSSGLHKPLSLTSLYLTRGVWLLQNATPDHQETVLVALKPLCKAAFQYLTSVSKALCNIYKTQHSLHKSMKCKKKFHHEMKRTDRSLDNS